MDMQRHHEKPDLLLQEVEKLGLIEFMEEMGANLDPINLAVASKFSQVIIMGPPDQKKIVNLCSEDYNLIRNSEIINAFEAAFIERGIKVKPRYLVTHGARFYIDYQIRGSSIEVAKDEILPQIRVHNSYDGRIKLGGNMGLYRVVCKNGMTVPVGDSNFSLSGKHTDSVRLLADELIEKGLNFIDKLEENVKPFERLAKKKVPNLEVIVDDITKATKFPSRQVENVIDVIQSEMDRYSLPATYWAVYNGFNNILNHSSEIAIPEHKREELDQAVLKTLLKAS